MTSKYAAPNVVQIDAEAAAFATAAQKANAVRGLLDTVQLESGMAAGEQPVLELHTAASFNNSARHGHIANGFYMVVNGASAHMCLEVVRPTRFVGALGALRVPYDALERANKPQDIRRRLDWACPVGPGPAVDVLFGSDVASPWASLRQNGLQGFADRAPWDAALDADGGFADVFVDGARTAYIVVYCSTIAPAQWLHTDVTKHPRRPSDGRPATWLDVATCDAYRFICSLARRNVARLLFRAATVLGLAPAGVRDVAALPAPAPPAGDDSLNAQIKRASPVPWLANLDYVTIPDTLYPLPDGNVRFFSATAPVGCVKAVQPPSSLAVAEDEDGRRSAAIVANGDSVFYDCFTVPLGAHVLPSLTKS